MQNAAAPSLLSRVVRWPLLALALLGALAQGACTDEVNGRAPDLAARLFVPRTFTLPTDHPLAYVTNTGTDALSVVDLTTMTVVARTPLGLDPIDRDGPASLAYDVARRRLYVAFTEPTASTYGPHSQTAVTKSGVIAVLDADDLAVEALWPVGRSPASLSLSADGEALWVSHSDGVRAAQLTQDIVARRATVGRLTGLGAALAGGGPSPALDLATVCVLPEGVVLDELRGRVAVACSGEASVAFLDASSMAVLSRVVLGSVGLSKPVGLALSSDRATWTVADRVTRTLSFLDAGPAPAVEASVDVEGIPGQPFERRPGEMLVPLTSPDAIQLVDTNARALGAQHRLADESCVVPRQFYELPPRGSDAGETPGRGALAGGALLLLCWGDATHRGRLLDLDPATFALRRAVDLEAYASSFVVRTP